MVYIYYATVQVFPVAASKVDTKTHDSCNLKSRLSV